MISLIPTNCVQDELRAGLQRAIKYTDSQLDGLVGRSELEGIRKLISDVKKEFHESLDSMSIRVKFDLLHDEQPQVASLKAYMESVELAMSRSQERIAFLEEGLLREEARGKSLEQGWNSTKESLDALVLTGELDVSKMKRDLKGVS